MFKTKIKIILMPTPPNLEEQRATTSFQRVNANVLLQVIIVQLRFIVNP